MAKHINPSWDRIDKNAIHSPAGVQELRRELKDALIRKYTGMAENLFQYNFDEFPQFEDMLLMTRDDEPEKTLMRNGQGAWFELNGQWMFLPVVFNSEINIFGNPVGWSPVPVGYVDGIDRGKSPARDRIRDMKLDATNSVLMKDNLFGRSDYSIIVKAVDALVDNYLTLNQLSLLAKSPFVFRVGPDNILDAKNYFLALSEDKPAIFKYNSVEELTAVTEQTNVTIDTGLFDVIRQWENMLLEQLGIPGSQKTQKRAQQSVDEVNMGEDMTSMRRKEKFKYRKLAIDRLNRMAGTNVEVISVIDSEMDNKEMEGSEDKESMGGEQDVQ